MSLTTSLPTAPDTKPDPNSQSSSRPVRNLWATWRSWSNRIFALREDQLFLFLAVLIGIFSGLAVVCFRMAIEWVHLVSLGSSMFPTVPRILIVPTAGGLVVALLVIYVFPDARGSGVNQTKAAVYISNGFIPFNTVVGKFVICALGIGTGQSLGPEDPSLQIGAGIASLMGRRLNLSQEKVRLIAPVGAAAGLAAAFNAPISSVIFVIEEVIGTWSAGVLGAIVLAAVSAVVTMRSFMGPESLFRVPPFRIARAGELLAYVFLGIIGGCASLLFLKWLAYARPRIQKWPSWTQYFQPAAAGLVIGFIGIRLPQVMGAGYSVIARCAAWPVQLEITACACSAQDFRDRIVVSQRRTRRHVRANALYRGHARWCRRQYRAPFFPEPHRNCRYIRARRHGSIFCGISANADHFGLHGNRGLGQLHRDTADHDCEPRRLPYFPHLPEGASIRSTFAPGRHYSPHDRRAARTDAAGPVEGKR